MKTFLVTGKLLGLSLLVILMCFSACKKNRVPTVIVDNTDDKYENPAFTSFSPAEGAMNTIITINGKGFSTVP